MRRTRPSRAFAVLILALSLAVPIRAQTPPATGEWVEPLDGGSLRFHMDVRYGAGSGLPWSGERKAGPQGEMLHFRRTFTPEGRDVLFGEFLMQRDGAWIHPEFPFEVPERGFEWHRVETSKAAAGGP